MVNMQVDPTPSTSGALEDLFADEPGKPLLGLPRMEDATEESMGDLTNPMVMKNYYNKLLPWKAMFTWLNQGHVPTKQFTHREFALTLQNDSYLRYQSFNNAEELKAEILRLNPSRFEIGPMYSGRPKDRKALMKSAFKPVSRELVFDIDMTDYDPVRTCCKDKAMCKRCWKFITVAVKVLDEILRADFGFQHILWVYSGRRGIHAWISDPAAMALTDEQRSSIVRYIDLIKGYEVMDKRINLQRPLHPALKRAYRNLKPAFDEVVLKDQDCLRTDPEQWDRVLKLLPDRDNSARLLKAYSGEAATKKSSVERWKEIELAPHKCTAAVAKKHLEATQEIIIQYTYPRIDTEVSKKQNHLLKAPFCVHPGTGKVCVPILASQIDDFNPETVPTVGKLLLELEYRARTGDTTADWSKTSLRPYVELFERHCEAIVKAKTRELRAANAKSMEF
ncbi:hypothetical protein JCM5350_001480 [Sporobolomyces pararoseus]